MKAGLTVLAAAGFLAACSSPPPAAGVRSSPNTPPAAISLPPDAVPWADVPYAAAPPLTAVPTVVTAADARPCRVADLQLVDEGSGGVTGNILTHIGFLNRSASTCLLAGQPIVAVSEPGQPTVLATPNTTWQDGSPGNQAPGTEAHVNLVTTSACNGGTGGPTYHEITMTLPHGGVMSIRLARGVSPRPCGAVVTGFAVLGPPPYPADPLAALAPMITVPANAHPGEDVVYVIRLTNSAGSSASLNPCPAYLQYGPVGVKQFYSLNCAMARPIAAHGWEYFVMKMQLPDSATGSTAICWGFADTAPTPACGTVDIR